MSEHEGAWNWWFRTLELGTPALLEATELRRREKKQTLEFIILKCIYPKICPGQIFKFRTKSMKHQGLNAKCEASSSDRTGIIESLFRNLEATAD